MNEAALRTRVREMMRMRALPATKASHIWGGPGIGSACAVCAEPVRPDEIGFELLFREHSAPPARAGYHVHTTCFGIWELERYRVGRRTGLGEQSEWGPLAEDEMRRQRDQLAHAQRLTTLGEMTASFAHELGQPLTAIIMNAQTAQQLLARQGLVSDATEALEDVIADAQRAAETLRRLRALFRKEVQARTRLDVDAAVEDALQLLKNEMQRRRIRAQFRHDAESACVLGDAIQLQQVVINLLVNAAEAVAAAGQAPREIDIERRRLAGGRVQILVRDSGIGVKESDLERIFEQFVSSKPRGLGMGLTISRSILEAHGGHIWATRNEHRGLTMHVELPLVSVDCREQ